MAAPLAAVLLVAATACSPGFGPNDQDLRFRLDLYRKDYTDLQWSEIQRRLATAEAECIGGSPRQAENDLQGLDAYADLERRLGESAKAWTTPGR
ncbi:MAG: hypothetical protein ACM31L_11365 [Actinomycetota bacterium]